MTVEQKIAYLKANPDRDAVVPMTRFKQFDLAGQFTASTVAAVMAANANAKVKFLTVGKPSDDDGTSDDAEHSSVGLAADYLNCEISGEAGAGCVHGDVDHIAKAAECLNNYAQDEAARRGHRDLVSQNSHHQSVRFA